MSTMSCSNNSVHRWPALQDTSRSLCRQNETIQDTSDQETLIDADNNDMDPWETSVHVKHPLIDLE